MEEDVIVTSLTVAKDVLYESDLELIREWVDFVRTMGNMRTVCRNWIGML